MAPHIVTFGLHNRDDNMTLRGEITKDRNEAWTDREAAQNASDLDTVIDRIDEIEERINKLEITISMRAFRPEHLSEPPEPFPGYNELMNEAIPVLKAAIAAVKKRELSHKVVPMKQSEE